MIHVIDLEFKQEKHSIASFLIPVGSELVLIETGPYSTFTQLEKGIADLGYTMDQVKHVFLTHIHFDHAGAAWKLAQMGAQIYVHPMGVKHLVNPEKLWNSAKMIYKDQMEVLWGEMHGIDESKITALDNGDAVTIGNEIFTAYYTPGHAVHHNVYVWNNKMFTGDVAGVKIQNGPVVPPCPPPDINLELWKQSIQKIKSINPECIYLTHYGKYNEVIDILNHLEIVLDQWANYILDLTQNSQELAVLEKEFSMRVREDLKAQGLSNELIQVYEYANPSWMSVAGLMRYWKLKHEGRI